MNLIVFAALVPLVLVQQVPPGFGDVNELATIAVGIAASFALGGVKKGLNIVSLKVGGVDQRIVNAIKPVQPLVLLGLTWALPRVAAAIGVVPPEAADFVNAPLATVIGVAAREGLRRVMPAPTPQPGPALESFRARVGR